MFDVSVLIGGQSVLISLVSTVEASIGIGSGVCVCAKGWLGGWVSARLLGVVEIGLAGVLASLANYAKPSKLL